MSDPEAIPGLRAALSVLTAENVRVKEDDCEFGFDAFADAYLNQGIDAEGLVLAFSTLAHKLLIELAKASRRSEEEWLGTLGRWINGMDAPS